MARQRGLALGWVAVVLLSVMTGCPAPMVQGQRDPTLPRIVPSSLRIPNNIARLAVLYPPTSNRMVAEAYSQLDGAAFQLKEDRPSLQIVDRSNLPTLLQEADFQYSGMVSDESAVKLGRVLGVDSVLLYRIEGPSLRDWIFAQYSGSLPPFVLISKIIRVETAEIVYHNVVSASVEKPAKRYFRKPLLFSESQFQPSLYAALDRGVAQTVADLRHAFR